MQVDLFIFEDVTVEYFTQHPEEIEPYLNERIAEYAAAGDATGMHAGRRAGMWRGSSRAVTWERQSNLEFFELVLSEVSVH